MDLSHPMLPADQAPQAACQYDQYVLTWEILNVEKGLPDNNKNINVQWRSITFLDAQGNDLRDTSGCTVTGAALEQSGSLWEKCQDYGPHHYRHPGQLQSDGTNNLKPIWLNNQGFDENPNDFCCCIFKSDYVFSEQCNTPPHSYLIDCSNKDRAPTEFEWKDKTGNVVSE